MIIVTSNGMSGAACLIGIERYATFLDFIDTKGFLIARAFLK
jgi:hypothetical protein